MVISKYRRKKEEEKKDNKEIIEKRKERKKGRSPFFRKRVISIMSQDYLALFL